MKFIVLTCLAALVFNTGAEDKKVNLCGSELARARVLLCYGIEYIFKRSSAETLDSKDYDDQRLGEAPWPWSTRHAAHVMSSMRWARNKRGLVDECCYKPCSTDTILSYCD